MNAIEALADREFATVLRHLDGELDERATLRLEVRLADELRLATGFEHVLVLDELQRRLAAKRRPRPRPR